MAQRRVLVWFGVAALAAACLVILATRIELDSDVINMLPKGFESVEGLKIYDRDFEQTRELTFALRCQPQDVDKLEEFAPTFAENLRKQPWCERVLAGSPMKRLTAFAIYNRSRSAAPESGAGGVRASDVDLAAGENSRAIAPITSGNRSGSPRPEFELAFDPSRNRPGAEAFRRSERARAGATACVTGPDDARFSRGHQSIVAERVRMSAVDASGKCLSRAGERWLGRRTVGSSRDRCARLTSPRFL